VNFGALIRCASPVVFGGPEEAEVARISVDSRRVGPGTLFVALRGEHADGHAFIPDAVEGGAIAVVTDRPVPELPDGVAWAQVPDATDALWRMAHSLYADPTARLKVIGVTGTNGKTTTAHLIRVILDHTGIECAYVGTLGAEWRDHRRDLGHTTPFAHDLAELLADAASDGVKAISMEVSSHALALHRADGCRFDVGTYTNLTAEHLDFHLNMNDYYAAKARLFTDLAEAGGKDFVGVINVDDLYGSRLATEVRGRVVTYGRQEGDVRAAGTQVAADSVRFTLETPSGRADVVMPLGGRFNVSNGLAAAATAWAMGLSPDTIASGLAVATPAPGRFESIPTGRGFSVIVDYAHSPDALEKLLEACRELRPKRLTVVFGCGGDRDRTKRPRMGSIAAELADRVIVTSDNPRTEDPDSIIENILAGITPTPAAAVEVEPDRRRAIHRAVQTARDGDLVVIAGKGHEDYQIIGVTKIHLDDRELVREALA